VDIRGSGGIVSFVGHYLPDILRHVPEEGGSDALFEGTTSALEQEIPTSKSNLGAPAVLGGLRQASIATYPSLSRKEFADILPEIKEGILAKLSAGQSSLRGSAVGGVIQKTAEKQLGYKVNIRASGGIVGFVDRYLSDILRHAHEDEGSDPLFKISASKLAQESPASRQELGSQISSLSHQRDFWRAFTNPNIDLEIAVDLRFQNIVIGRPPAHTDNELLRLTKINALTQYSWARNFAESVIPTEHRATALALLDSRKPEDFASKWISFLTNGSMVGYSSKWERFRVEKASATLREQLLALQCPEGNCVKLVNDLVESQAAAKRGVILARIPATIREPMTQTDTSAAVDILRSLAHYALDCASVETLRETKIPLGVVIDFLQHQDTSKVRHN